VSARAWWIGLVVYAALFAFAFAAAPSSCEWGLGAYVWAGIASVAVLTALPFALRLDASAAKRMAIGLALAVGGLAIWIAGLFTANVRILCRLF
jgi:hypothetical protein